MLPSARYGLRAASLGESRRRVGQGCSQSWQSHCLSQLIKSCSTKFKGDILYVTGGDDGSAQDMDEVKDIILKITRTSWDQMWAHSTYDKCFEFLRLFTA